MTISAPTYALLSKRARPAADTVPVSLESVIVNAKGRIREQQYQLLPRCIHTAIKVKLKALRTLLRPALLVSEDVPIALPIPQFPQLPLLASIPSTHCRT